MYLPPSAQLYHKSYKSSLGRHSHLWQFTGGFRLSKVRKWQVSSGNIDHFFSIRRRWSILCSYLPISLLGVNSDQYLIISRSNNFHNNRTTSLPLDQPNDTIISCSKNILMQCHLFYEIDFTKTAKINYCRVNERSFWHTDHYCLNRLGLLKIN